MTWTYVSDDPAPPHTIFSALLLAPALWGLKVTFTSPVKLAGMVLGYAPTWKSPASPPTTFTLGIESGTELGLVSCSVFETPGPPTCALPNPRENGFVVGG